MASLHIAVLFGNEELTRTLLEEGCDPNVYDERLGSPLSIAILKGYRSIVKLLSEKGADHNDERFTSALLPDRSETVLPNHQPVPSDNETESVLSLNDGTGGIGSTGPDRPIGSRSEIKRLFKNKSKWEDAPDDKAALSNIRDLAEGPYAAYAVVEYMKRNKEGVWILSKIDIHGSKLCGFLFASLGKLP
ncbi:hypothetical protein GGS24DRAFT_506408 [Hypoxylon argillaceum]|nr:hypothetical protein GGS24DRAFT_506408 [Hypoxylon argillaceum]